MEIQDLVKLYDTSGVALTQMICSKLGIDTDQHPDGLGEIQLNEDQLYTLSEDGEFYIDIKYACKQLNISRQAFDAMVPDLTEAAMIAPHRMVDVLAECTQLRAYEDLLHDIKYLFLGHRSGEVSEIALNYDSTGSYKSGKGYAPKIEITLKLKTSVIL